MLGLLVAALVTVVTSPAAPFVVAADDARPCCAGEAGESGEAGDHPESGDDCCPGDCGACHISCCGQFLVLGDPRNGPAGLALSESSLVAPAASRPRPAPARGIDRPPRA
jgi:hypothetical protein